MGGIVDRIVGGIVGRIVSRIVSRMLIVSKIVIGHYNLLLQRMELLANKFQFPVVCVGIEIEMPMQQRYMARHRNLGGG